MEAHGGVEDLGPGGILFIDYEELLHLVSSKGTGPEALGPALEGEWAWLYERATIGNRDLRSFTVGTFTYLWDTTAAEVPEPEPRLVGVYGTTSRPNRPRDRSRMSGYPLRQPEGGRPLHRGHGVAHSLGGPDEGYNLFAQAASVNLGSRWRGLERYAAAQPGIFIFIRCVYADASSTPSALEYGILCPSGELVLQRFLNA